jgi:hypothetical protein
VARGEVPLVLHLLAPNKRAVQVTTDLAGFWERHYPRSPRSCAGATHGIAFRRTRRRAPTGSMSARCTAIIDTFGRERDHGSPMSALTSLLVRDRVVP